MKILHVEDEPREAKRVEIALENNEITTPDGFAELIQVENLEAFKASFLKHKPEIVISDGSFPLNDNGEQSKDFECFLIIRFLEEQGYNGKLIIDSPSAIDIGPYQNLAFQVTRHQDDIPFQIKELNCKLDAEFAKTRLDKSRLENLDKILRSIAELTEKHELTSQINQHEVFLLGEAIFFAKHFQDNTNDIFYIESFDQNFLTQIYLILTKANENLRPGELKDSVVSILANLELYTPANIIEEVRERITDELQR